ncbi:MAG TPA: hypothetical protein PK403_02900, partial [Plasticicumulans sp.]|nr:hypothetical protein [Plasticicumulans sp.]
MIEPTSFPPAVHDLLSDYAPGSGWDELLDADGKVRPAWEYLLAQLDALGLGELQARHEETQRLLRENGVTFNAHEDGRAASRAWTLDPIPLPILGDEWAQLEAGLAQRSRLLNRLAADL